jgi:hypothetical protein
MAYQDYQDLYNASMYGYDTDDEERRRREALAEEEARKANQPVTQKITYNPDGTQKMTISGTPEALSAANPYTPTVTGPVNPAEMPRPQYAPPGPPPGSRFPELQERAMPQTSVPQPQAQMPQAQVPQPNMQMSDRAGEDINAYIQRLYEKRMPGFNPNAPVGQEAMAQSPAQAPQPVAPQPIITDQGQTIGRETPAQMMAGAETNAPVAPTMPTMTTMPVSTQVQAPPAQPYGPQVTMNQAPSAEEVYATRLVEAQRDPLMLAQLRQDSTAPEWVRRVATETNYDQTRQQVEEQRARQKIQADVESGNFTALGRALQQKGDEGSWGKYILYSILNSDRLAKSEANKLGIGSEWRSSTMGDQPTLIKFRADGLPMEGYNARTGAKLNAEELASSAGNMTAIKGAQASSTRIRDEKGNEWNFVPTPQGPMFYDNAGRRGTPQGRTVPITAGSDVVLQNELQLNRIRNNIQGLKAEERIKVFENVNKVRAAEGLPLFSTADIGIDSRGNLIGMGGGGAPAPAPTTGGGARPTGGAATGGAAAAATQQPTAEVVREREARGGARKEIAKTAGEVVAGSQETQNLINKIDNTIVPIIDSGKHNIGPALSGLTGRGPVAQAIGSQFETEDAKNTRTVMETIDMLAIEGLKSLGANPSTRDLEFYTKNKPQANSDPEFVKSWIQSRSAALKRKLGYAGGQVEAGGAAGVAPPVQNQPSVSNW